MADKQLTLMAHLMRRAGFGATRDELENYVAKGYEATVEELLQDESATEVLEDEDIIRRYHVDGSCVRRTESAQWYWLYRMIHTKRPLEEKIAVFWHGIFCVGTTKLNQPKVILSQVDMFRRYGMGSFRTLLVQLSRNPAMLFYLDNKDSHKDALNENYGRELLELFSLGVGMDGHPNYSEDDVRECSRAFTGWTIRNASYHAARSSRNSVWPYGRLDWQFEYKDEDHDDGEKTFLGQKGRFNGEDIIDIICQQPATARFVCRHLYNFFVADEPQVPAWQNVPPRDPEAIKTLTDAFISSGYEIRSVLRVLFNSDFFKNAALAKVKSPVELVAGTARLGGSYNFPDVAETGLASDMTFMGQMLLDPPSVEGWHTGVEWITTGSLVDRVNFASQQLADVDKPGVRSIIDRIRAQGDRLSPEGLVDSCLDLIGPIPASESTRQELIAHAKVGGDVRFGSEGENRSAAERVKEMLQLIVATREYQLV